MTKETSLGWPDPADWAKRLASILTEGSEAYHAAGDAHDAQKILARILTRLVSSLYELPPFTEGGTASPLMQLADALTQASDGLKPALLENRKLGGERRSSAYWQAAKAQAVVSYYTLAEAAHADPAGFVAKEMNRARLARRRGEKQTAKSIMRFVREYETASTDLESPPWVQFAFDKLTGFKAAAEWPVTVAEATSYTRKAMASQRLKPFIPDPQSQA